MESDLITTIEVVLLYGAAIIGAASLIVKGLKKVAVLTPTKTDDKYVGIAEKFLDKAIAVLDRVALNPDKDSARPK